MSHCFHLAILSAPAPDVRFTTLPLTLLERADSPDTRIRARIADTLLKHTVSAQLLLLFQIIIPELSELSSRVGKNEPSSYN